MRHPWLILALGTVGCFEAHGPLAPARDASSTVHDAGSTPVDAGAICGPRAGSVHALVCSPPPFPDGLGRVTITGGPSGCCAGASVATAVRARGPFAWSLDLEWTACDCCDVCGCVGPSIETSVEVGPLGVGMHTITVGAVSCTIEVEPEPECRSMGGQVRAPAVLLEDQPLAITFTQSEARGCGCRPVLESTADELAFAPELCGCCPDCDCIDQGYEASATVASPGLGHAVYPYPWGVHEVDVVPFAQCHPIDVDSVRVVGPDPRYARTGPDLWWAEISGTTSLCCSRSMPAVAEVRGPPTLIALSLLECALDPCDCIGPPAPTRAWYSLDELASGEHTVRAGDAQASFVVP